VTADGPLGRSQCPSRVGASGRHIEQADAGTTSGCAAVKQAGCHDGEGAGDQGVCTSCTLTSSALVNAGWAAADPRGGGWVGDVDDLDTVAALVGRCAPAAM